MSTAPDVPTANGGVRRKVDDLGRVVLPVSMRRTLGIEPGDSLNVRLVGTTLQLHKPSATCVMCDSTERLSTVLNRPICWSCVASIRALGRLPGNAAAIATPNTAAHDGVEDE